MQNKSSISSGLRLLDPLLMIELEHQNHHMPHHFFFFCICKVANLMSNHINAEKAFLRPALMYHTGWNCFVLPQCDMLKTCAQVNGMLSRSI